MRRVPKDKGGKVDQKQWETDGETRRLDIGSGFRRLVGVTGILTGLVHVLESGAWDKGSKVSVSHD